MTYADLIAIIAYTLHTQGCSTPVVAIQVEGIAKEIIEKGIVKVEYDI